jgi:hypothetical protein
MTLDQPSTQGTSEMDEKNLMDMSLRDLPNWAQRTLQAGQQMSDNLQGSPLPKWAQKAGLETSPGALVVVESAEEQEVVDRKDVTSTLINLDETGDVSKWKKEGSGGDGASGLPKWARKDTPAVVGAVDDGAIDMPLWARQELEVDETDEKGTDAAGINGENTDVDASEEKSSSEVSNVVTHVKMVEGVSSTMETDESETKSQIVLFEDKHATKESEEQEKWPSTKTVVGEHVTKESKDNPMEYQYTPPQLRSPDEIYRDLEKNTSGYEIRQSRRSLDMGNLPKNILQKHVSEESKKLDAEYKRPNIHGHHSDETTEMNVRSDEIRHKRFQELNVYGHSSKESDEVVKTVTRNIHGHHSEQSELKDVDAGRLKKFKEQNVHGHASVESKVPDMDTINMMNMERFRERNIHGHASSESSDMDVMRLQKFKQRNRRGHSSDSTVQKLLYGVDKFVTKVAKDAELSDGENAGEFSFCSS